MRYQLIAIAAAATVASASYAPPAYESTPAAYEPAPPAYETPAPKYPVYTPSKNETTPAPVPEHEGM